MSTFNLLTFSDYINGDLDWPWWSGIKPQNLTEEQGDTLLVGRRQMTSSGHVLYHVGVSTGNATSGFSGHYQCVVERQYDRLFVVATVGVEGRQSPQIEMTHIHNTWHTWPIYI